MSTFNSSEKNLYDVIVIGGGPAGSAAAITASRRGLKVLQLEAATGPRERPGETLHPGIEGILRQLGVLSSVERACYIRPTGVTKNAEFVPYGKDSGGTPWRGYQILRETFDEILLQQAGKNSCLIRGATARKIVREESWRVATSAGDFSAVTIIDASGAARWLPRKLELSYRFRGPEAFMKYGFGKSGSNLPDCQITTSRTGWCWVAKLPDNQYSWCVLGFGHQPKVDLPYVVPCGPTRSLRARWAVLSRPASQDYYVCGDSALWLDPGAGKGILRGLMMGILAAECAYQANADAELGQQVAESYSRLVHDWFTHECEALTTLYAPCLADQGEIPSLTQTSRGIV